MNGVHTAAARPLTQRFRHFLAAVGPGLVVMLADTETGSVIASAQSGARWGLRMLPLLLLLIPLLYLAQELTIRLALGTGKGYGELVLRRFGRAASWLSTATLLISCFGALLTQLSGLAGIGEMLGVPPWQSVSLLALLIFLMVATGSYRSVERVAIALGVFELAFLAEAWLARPEPAVLLAQLHHLPWRDHDFLYLAAANIGTCIMPWTIFYQQSALLDKGLGQAELKAARLDTLLGAALCQLITAAILIAAAQAFGGGHGGQSLDSVVQLADGFGRLLGPVYGRLLFALALAGGALVATIVVCLSAAWALGEASGRRHSLAEHPRQAPWFYGCFGLMLLAGALLVSSGVNLIRLSLASGVVNAVLLPVTLGFLYWLARSELRDALRPRGAYAGVLALALALTAGFSLYAGLAGALGAG